MATSENPILDEITQELNEKLEPSLLPLFDQRDGAARLAQALPNVYSPEKIIDGSSSLSERKEPPQSLVVFRP